MRNPPPPGADWPDVDNVKTVPAASALGSDTEFVAPAPEPVVVLIMADTAVHVPVVALTVHKVQVVEAPVYEKIVMLGLQAEGTTTASVALRPAVAVD
jgi:hypothetical protein